MEVTRTALTQVIGRLSTAIGQWRTLTTTQREYLRQTRAAAERGLAALPEPFLMLLDNEGLKGLLDVSQMEDGERLVIEIVREGEKGLIVTTRTTANGVRTTANGVVTRPDSTIEAGRIPTEPDPEPEVPPPPSGGTVDIPNWFSWGGIIRSDAPPTIECDGTEAGCTFNSDEGYIDDTRTNRVFTATVNVRAEATSTIGKTARLVWRERLSDGTSSETEVSVVLTEAYQALEVEHDGVENDRPIDLRVSITGAILGDKFSCQGLPSFSYEDVVDPDPGPGSGDPFAYPYYTQALVNSRVDSLTVRSDSTSAVSAFNSRLAAAGYRVSTFNNGEAPPIYVGNPTSHNNYAVSVAGYSQSWRLPSNATDGGGSDHPLMIRMASHPVHGAHVELRLWQASINHTARTITASNYGVFRFNNDGIKHDGGRHSVGRSIENSGARGAGNGLSYGAGMITRQEVIDGEIRHCIRMAFGPGGQTSSGNITSGFVAPAIKSDQSGTISGAVPMGSRFRLKASVNPDSRTVPGRSNTSTETRFLRMFCRALQRYGLMPSDGTGGGHGVYMENSTTGQWSTHIGSTVSSHYGWILRDNRASDGISRSSTDGVPWTELEVVQNISENLT
jgi:hypothetical protein